MAMICKNGVAECTGCMRCEKAAEIAGKCSFCSEAIFATDNRYAIDGELIHEDCLMDWAEQFLTRGVV